jgi:membrane protease YdiL (CAAX protease family)
MKAHTPIHVPGVEATTRPDRKQQLGLSILFLLCGMLVFGVFGHYFPFYSGAVDWLGRILCAGGFLAVAFLARRSARFQAYWLIALAYFVALVAISIDYYLGLSAWINPALGVAMESPAGWAIDKLESSLLGIVIILLLNRLAGQRLGDVYIRRGNLRLGLAVGLVAFVVMVAAVIPVSETYFQAQNVTWARLLAWSPWVLIFVLANASFEELLFRGLFIGKLEPFIGRFATNLVTTIPFVYIHSYTGYADDQMVFLALQLLPLSLAWCWLMQKTNSVWGSILFHAAMDIPIVVGIFSNL